MKIIKSFKYRLKPTKEQTALLLQHGGNNRFLWNKLVSLDKEYKLETSKFLSQSELQRKIIELKSENDFLKITHSQPLQIHAQRLFQTNLKALNSKNIAERQKRIAIAKQEVNEVKRNKKLAKALNYGFPNFKKKSDENDSIFYPQNFKVCSGRVYLAKLGIIKFIQHRKLEGNPKYITITQNGNQWHISVSCEIDIEEKLRKKLEEARIAGIDLGIKEFAVIVDNDGGISETGECGKSVTIENPKILKKYLAKLKREQKVLSRKQFKEIKNTKGEIVKESSKNRIKQKSIVRKIHGKVVNVRKDFLHKLTHDMTTKYDGFCMETLDILEMIKNNKKENKKACNRSISDVSWYEFGRQLEYKSLWNSKYFVKIGQYEKSTQTCIFCGNEQNMNLNERIHVCEKCGKRISRDLSSAIYIRRRGLEILNNKNTVSTTGIKACGPDSLESGMKQEKRRLPQPLLVGV